MKTKKILLPLLLFVLTACNLTIKNPYFSTSNGNASSSNGQNTTSSNSQNASSSNSQNTSSTSPVTPLNKMNLGDFGDYVEYVGQQKQINIQQEYEKLTQKVIGEVNGIFQTNYEQGLLNFFNLDNEVKLDIVIPRSELEKMNDDHNKGNKESYRICDVEITYNDFLFHYENVGIRQKGNTSRGSVIDGDKLNLRHYKLNFAEVFDDEFRQDIENITIEEETYRKDRTFFGLEKIDIRWNRNQDGTYLKEHYAFETYRRNGVLAPRTNPVNMSMIVDGQKQNMGIYLAVEDINKDFIKRNLIESSAGGDLYKLGWTDVGAMFNSTESRLFGAEKQVKDGSNFRQIAYPYDLKTNKKTSTHADLIAFINGVKNTNVSSFDAFLKTSAEYDYFIKYAAIAYLLGDPDDLRGNANNAYIYFTKDTKKALIIPTDNDRVLGSTGGSNPTGNYGTKTNPFDKKTGYGSTPLLFEKSITSNGNSLVKEDYLEAIKDVVDNGSFNFLDFESLYNKVYANYKDNLDLGNLVNHHKIEFKIEEENSIYANNNLSARVYFQEKINTFKAFIGEDIIENPVGPVPNNTYYLVGDFTSNWGFLNENILTRNSDGTYSIEKYVQAGARGKIALHNWAGKEYNYTHLEDKTLFENSNNNNIRFLESGTYVFTLVDEGTLRIEKK